MSVLKFDFEKTHMLRTAYFFVALFCITLLQVATLASACPFCQATSQTISEEMKTSDAAVLARIVKQPLAPDVRPDGLGGFGTADPDTGLATFKIVEILHGKLRLIGIREIEVTCFPGSDKDKLFFITGIGEEKIDWGTPIPLSPLAEKYIAKLGSLPEKGPKRLAFFQDYLECNDPLLTQDSYDEFAIAPYAELIAMKPLMQRETLLEWIFSPDVPLSRRRLYLTMLGVCAEKSDAAKMEYLIRPTWQENNAAADVMLVGSFGLIPELYQPAWHEAVAVFERQKRQGLDALVACYLTLQGEKGLPFIENQFLKNEDSEYSEIIAVIMALRFMGEETTILPREKLLAAMRLVLDKPSLADQVIIDLSRWEDWSIIDRLVTMFKIEGDEYRWTKQPIITYMTVASEQEGEIGKKAKAAMEELKRIDPKKVKDTLSMQAFGFLRRARSNDKKTSDADKKNIKNSEGIDTDSGTSAFDVRPNENEKTAAEENNTEESIAGTEPTTGEKPASNKIKRDEAANKKFAAELEIERERKRKATQERVTAKEIAPYSTTTVVAIPAVIGIVLFAAYWLIMRTSPR